jgi:CheY-like chemotaxis protein
LSRVVFLVVLALLYDDNGGIMDSSAIKQYDDEKLKIRILVVDDEIDVIYIVKRILEEVGLFQVDAFVDPTVALSYFRPDRYDLVILDIRMPDINGLELYKKIKEIDEKVKVCFLSAVYDLSDYKQTNPALVDAIESGKECFIDKPIGSKKLLSQMYKTINPDK